ncbi:MAG: SPOR domain-containing protein [Deltaproteobacteria bacterium]|nr:SPOR domain-containing protein [Deltaproteobacteria bacterium]
MLPAHYNKKESNYFCRFTFGQFFTILVLEIFTLFFIFYLGARYGDELLGVKKPLPVAVAEPEGLPRVTSTDANVVSTMQDPEIKAMAKDLLQKSSSPDLKQRVAEMLEDSAGRTRPLPPREKSDWKTAPTPVTAAPRPTVEASPPKEEPVITAAPKQEPVVQTAPTAPFSVQVGSYPNADEAHTMVDYWKKKGEKAWLVSADIPGRGRWYRVRLGGFQNKEEASSYLKNLQSDQEVDGFVVTNE